MKTFILIFLSCLLSQSSFQDKILNDFDSNSRFLVLKVKSAKYEGSVIVENDDFYIFLNQNYSYDKIKYATFVKKVLNKKLTVKIKDEDFDKYNFSKIKKSKKVDNDYKKGAKKFLNIYFVNNKVLKDGISDDIRNAVIAKLFTLQISSYIDDETGYLIVG